MPKDPAGLKAYGAICGWTLARAHARSGDAVAIGAYLGTGARFDHAMASFSETYADQNERDYQALQEAGMGIADEREALVIDIEDRPGTLGELARSLGEVSVNIELAYTTFGGVKVVIVTDDIDNARAALA